MQEHALTPNTNTTGSPLDPLDEEPVQRPDTVSPPSGKSSSEPCVFPVELGGRDGPEPTRFGDWEKAGRCIDF